MNDKLIAEARELLNAMLGDIEDLGYAKCHKPSCDTIKELIDALEAAEKQIPRWIPVEEGLPENSKPVLALGYAVNNAKYTTTFKGRWIAEHTMLASDFGADDDMALIYDENEDEYYVPEGWFERIENWEDYTDVAVGDYIVSAWMPLPKGAEEEK